MLYPRIINGDGRRALRLHLYMWSLSLYIYIHITYISLYMYIYVYITCVYIYIYIYIHVHNTCMYIYMYAYMYICICVHIYISLSIYIYICIIIISIYLSLYKYLSLYIYIWSARKAVCCSTGKLYWRDVERNGIWWNCYGRSLYWDSWFQRVWLNQNLNLKGWNSQAHRELLGKFESSNLSRDNLSRELGRSEMRRSVAVLQPVNSGRCIYIYIYTHVGAPPPSWRGRRRRPGRPGPVRLLNIITILL